jgi:adenylate cyclase
MAVFGVPDSGPNDAAHAVDAAFALSCRSLAWLQEVAETAPVPIWVKLGAHYGPVVVSRLGGETHQHITVTGDCVNIASRLMASAAQHGAVLACSADLVEAARVDGDDRHEFSDTQIVDLRGRSNPMVVRFWSPVGCARPDLLPEPSM